MLTLENLPQDVKEALPQDAQRLYVAAYNSFFENSHSEAAAARVAWQTIELNEHYVRGADGKWQRRSVEEDGGAGDKALGDAPQS
jgi:cation transport regulator